MGELYWTRPWMKKDVGGFEQHYRENIASGLCSGCGLCVSVCPTKGISITKAEPDPELTGSCRASDVLLPKHCGARCPVGIDVARHNRFISQGRFDEALATVRRAVPFAGLLCPRGDDAGVREDHRRGERARSRGSPAAGGARADAGALRRASPGFTSRGRGRPFAVRDARPRHLNHGERFESGRGLFDQEAEPLLRRLIGPLVLWDESDAGPESVRWEASVTAGLLEGLVHDVASPTGQPILYLEGPLAA
jgi:ferredoxin